MSCGAHGLRRLRRSCLYSLILTLVLAANAVGAERPRRFILHEHMIRDVRTAVDPQACSPGEVLRDLFAQIAPSATVYPTENYYYFSFHRGGKSYSGSLRLALDSRDKGILQYACYETYTGWLEVDPKAGVQKDLSASDGVVVTKIGDFEYDVAVNNATVKFLLNRIDQTPNNDNLAAGEKFAGRIFDDSGLTFDLVYNPAAKAFYFVLDSERGVSDAFVKLKSRVYVGKRTGFVFFEDGAPKRLILIAAHSEEIAKNTAYDGPFDQLPENFYKEIDFWKYVYDAYPGLAGKLTPGGTEIASGLIFALAPYRHYRSRVDLRFADACMRNRPAGTKLILCLIGEPRLERRR